MRKALAALVLFLGLSGSARADSITSRLQLTVPDIGSSGWGVKLNTGVIQQTDLNAAAQFAANTFTSSNTFKNNILDSGFPFDLTGANGYINVQGSSITAQGFFGSGLGLTGITGTSLTAGSVDTTKIAPGAVDTTKLVNAAVTTNILADSAVTTVKIANAAVDTSKLATDSVSNAKILAGSVDTNKLASGAAAANVGGLAGDLTGLLPSPTIANSAVTTAKIAAAAVDTTKLAPGSVDTTKIVNGAVTTNQIADSAVTTVKVANAAIDTAKLASDSVTNVKILAASVDTSKLSSGAAAANVGGLAGDLTGTLPSPSIAALAVTTAKIANAAVDTTKLAPGSVDTTKIVNGAVTTNQIADSAVTTVKVAAAAIDTTKLAPGSVDTTKLVNGAVTTNILSDSSVTTVKIAAASVDTTKIAPGSVDTTKLVNGAVGTNQLQSAAVDTSKLASGNFMPGGIYGQLIVRGITTAPLLVKGNNGAGTDGDNHGAILLGNSRQVGGMLSSSDIGNTLVALDSEFDNAVSRMAFRMRTNGNDVEAINILGSGNVGVGTSSPTTTLDVNGNAQFGSGAAKSTFTATGALTVGGTGVSYFNGGNLGVGTANPSSKIHMSTGVLTVDGNNGSHQIKVSGWDSVNGTNSNGGSIAIGGVASGNYGVVHYNAGASGDMYLDNATDSAASRTFMRMRTDGTALNAIVIDGSAKVGIGTSSPNSKLHVVGPSSLTVPGERITSSANTLSVTHANVNFRSALGFNSGTGVPFMALHAEHSLVSANTYANDDTGNAGFAMYHDQAGTPCIVHAWNGSAVAGADFSGTINTLKVCSDGSANINGSTMTVASSGILTVPSQPSMCGEMANAVSLAYNSVQPLYFGTNQTGYCTTSSNTQGVFDATNSSGVVTFPTVGRYHVDIIVNFTAAVGGTREVLCKVNGTRVAYAHQPGSAVGAEQTVSLSFNIRNTTVGFQMICYAYQNQTSAAALNMTTDNRLNVYGLP